MFCTKCGNQVGETEKFCSNCGSPIQVEEKEPKCPKCGADIKGDKRFCVNCGEWLKKESSNNASTTQEKVKSTDKKSDSASGRTFLDFINEPKKCLPAFIIGLIGSIFGLFGGTCRTMCSCGSASDSAFFMIFGGAIIAMIGTCLCLNKAKIGGPVILIGAIMIIIRAYSDGAEFMTIFSFVLLLAAGIVGTLFAYFSDIINLFNKTNKK